MRVRQLGIRKRRRFDENTADLRNEHKTRADILTDLQKQPNKTTDMHKEKQVNERKVE